MGATFTHTASPLPPDIRVMNGANALPRLTGNFLTMNLQQARAAFESVPWVRHATVRRVWPLHLVVALEEHRPAAYWETKAENADADSEAVVDTRLVNSFGEVFEANLGDVEDEDLPTLAGPAKSSAAMLAMWRQLDPLTHGKLDEGVARLDCPAAAPGRRRSRRGRSSSSAAAARPRSSPGMASSSPAFPRSPPATAARWYRRTSATNPDMRSGSRA